MRVLHVIHDFLPRHQAGSEIYASELIQAQRTQGLDAQVLCAEYDLAFEHGTFRRRLHEGIPVTELINNWRFKSFEETYRSGFLNTQLRDELRALAPDVLHIHNLLNLSFDLPAIAHELGIPSVATLHDYTLVCPSGGQRVHQAESYVCSRIEPDRCSRCFAQHVFYAHLAFGQLPIGGIRRARLVGRVAQAVNRATPRLFSGLSRLIRRRSVGPGVSSAQIEARLDYVGHVFDAVDLFIAPSPSLAAEYKRLGVPSQKLRVSDYGFKRFAPLRRTPTTGRLRIGFVGTLVWHKGAHVLIEAVRALPPDACELKLFGDTQIFPGYVAALREQARGLPVRFMGRFEREQVPAVYADIDVLVVPSLWLENSPLVIHEAFMAGVPVVGSRMGGTVDLVMHGQNGLLYDAFSDRALAAALQSLLDDRAQLAKLAGAQSAVKDIDRDAAECAAIYNELRAARGSTVVSGDGRRP